MTAAATESRRRFDVEAIKADARGRWPEIIPALTALAPSFLTTTHGPCPRCGGRDRYRTFDDFAETGGVICNQCHRDGGDGLSTLAWLLNEPDFPTVLAKVAEYLGQSPASNGDAKPSSPAAKQETKFDANAIAWIPWSSRLMAKLDQWCAARPPIKPESVLALGGRACLWPNSRDHGRISLGFCARNHLTGEATAANVFPMDGGLNVFKAYGKLPERKTHLIRTSKKNGWYFPGSVEDLAQAQTIHSVEGLPDLLALHSVAGDQLKGHLLVTGACGAKGVPDCSIGTERSIVVIGDCDDSGIEGRDARAKAFSEAGATQVKLAELPYELTESHGKDLRDWLAEGHTFTDYLALAAQSRDFIPEAPPEKVEDAGSDDTFRNYYKQGTGKDAKTKPFEMADLVTNLHGRTEDWPRRCGSSLFVDDPSHGICWLESESSLFAWIQARLGIVKWAKALEGAVSKRELYEELRRTSQKYESIETLPHEPPISGHYYACSMPSPGDGRTLEKLLDRFAPATPLDRDLILAMFATLIWGGPPGSRPAFVITAESGRGAGKTRLATMAGHLAGGVIDFSSNDDVGTIKSRLLSPEGLAKRVAMLDNIKSLRFSWGELEALLTAPVISGRRLYCGEASRPNVLNWCLTLNGASLSTDLAQRVIVIKLDRPQRSATWEEDTTRLVVEHRQELLADLVAFLRGPQRLPDKFSRWASWETDVLSRLPDPNAAQALILARQAEADVEVDETAEVDEFFGHELRKLGFAIDREAIHIPSRIAARWLNLAVGENHRVTSSTRMLKQMINERRLPHLGLNPSRTAGRGFLWVGDNVDVDAVVRYDVEEAIAKWMKSCAA
jgi:hypothetical protein